MSTFVPERNKSQSVFTMSKDKVDIYTNYFPSFSQIYVLLLTDENVFERLSFALFLQKNKIYLN